MATDKGFKERVQEDMLVRLLDAFVWRSNGMQMHPLQCFLILQQLSDKRENDLGFTYVQGMNVLAAPFLYTMPSELEAFFCFSKFIEESCPLYVQPTLEGVHRGLKVPLLHSNSPVLRHLTYSLFSFLIDVSNSLILNCLDTYDPKICRQKYMLFRVVLLLD